MKRLVFIGWTLLLAFVACNPWTMQTSESVGESSEKLAAIDSLMWHQPDSALTLIKGYFARRDVSRNVSEKTQDLLRDVSVTHDSMRDVSGNVSTRELDRHYANLLLAELRYKNDFTQANRAELRHAVAYFDSLVRQAPPFKGARGINTTQPNPTDHHFFLCARTHYINGVGYYERDSVVEACREYIKAIDVMESHFGEKDLVGQKAKFMALTYTHLSGLFSDLYLHEQAIYFGKMALEYYQNYDATPWHIAWVLDEIGSHYDMVKDYDSADFYYRKSLTALADTNNLTYRDIATHLAFLSYKKDGFKDAALFQLRNLIGLSESEKECLSRHLTIGEIFFHETMFDSAWIHLDKVFHETQSIASKKVAAQRLVEICTLQHRDEESYEYALFLAPFANKDENNGTIKSQLSELYNIFRQTNLERQHQQTVNRSRARSATAIGGLIIIVVAIALLYIENKKRQSRVENQKLDENLSQDKAWNNYEQFLNEALCQEITHSIQGENIKRVATPSDYPQLVLSDAQLQQLAFITTRYFGSFESLLGQRGLKANPVLVNLCHLYMLGMDEKQAAILLNRDYSSIKRYEKKLKTVFETQENMVSFLRNLVLNG